MTELTGKDLYQIKVTLADSKPPVWRRLVVPKTIPLDELHAVIQLAMGWTNSHLYLFEKDHLQYGIEDEDFPTELKNAGNVSLKSLLRKENEKMVYEYDFGDGWYHIIQLEKTSVPDDDVSQIPVCIKGKETCPAEDSGGVWGYYQKLEEIQDVDNPEREELHEWLMQGIEEREYDLKAINTRLANLYA